MRREERRRKFQEAVINTLYPPPRPEDEEEEANPSREDFDAELINPDDLGEVNSSSTDDVGGGSESEFESQKMTRAQRKRLRKNKLKEEASRRSELGIIGPLLPSSTTDDAVHKTGNSGDVPDVRQNAPESQIHKPGDPPGGTERNKKLKHRRVAKRLAREKLKSTETEIGNQDEKNT